MSFRVGTALLLVVLGGALFAGAATAGQIKEVKSKVKITEGGPTHFEGKVTSKEDKCLKRRKVTLRYSFGGPYKDDVVGKATTDGEGIWEMDGGFVAGLYVASVTAKERGDLLCRAARGVRMQF